MVKINFTGNLTNIFTYCNHNEEKDVLTNF